MGMLIYPFTSEINLYLWFRSESRSPISILIMFSFSILMLSLPQSKNNCKISSAAQKPTTLHLEVWQCWMNIEGCVMKSWFCTNRKAAKQLKLQLHCFSPDWICKRSNVCAWWDEPSVYLDFLMFLEISVVRTKHSVLYQCSFTHRGAQFTHQVIFEGNWLDCFSILGYLSTAGWMQMHDIPFQILFTKQFESCALLYLGHEQQNIKTSIDIITGAKWCWENGQARLSWVDSCCSDYRIKITNICSK